MNATLQSDGLVTLVTLSRQKIEIAIRTEEDGVLLDRLRQSEALVESLRQEVLRLKKLCDEK